MAGSSTCAPASPIATRNACARAPTPSRLIPVQASPQAPTSPKPSRLWSRRTTCSSTSSRATRSRPPKAQAGPAARRAGIDRRNDSDADLLGCAVRQAAAPKRPPEPKLWANSELSRCSAPLGGAGWHLCRRGRAAGHGAPAGAAQSPLAGPWPEAKSLPSQSHSPRINRSDLFQVCRGAISVQLPRSEEHTSELQSLRHLVCRLLLELPLPTPHLRSFPTRRSSDLRLAPLPARPGCRPRRARWGCAITLGRSLAGSEILAEPKP